MDQAQQTKAAGFLMGLTYAAGALGIGLAFSRLFSATPDLRWGCLFAVGVAGVLSYVRHSIMHRGDAAFGQAFDDFRICALDVLHHHALLAHLAHVNVPLP